MAPNDAMTAAQAAYLKGLSERAGVPFDASLSRAEASRRIDELRRADGRRSRLERDDPAPRKGHAVREAASFDERMTETQAAYLRELLETGGELDASLSKQAAQQKIAELLVKRMSTPTEPSGR